VADIEGVAVVEGVHDLVEDIAGFGFTEMTLSSNSFEEFTTGADSIKLDPFQTGFTP